MSTQLKDYDYLFPATSIAQVPLGERSAARMMVFAPHEGPVTHGYFQDLPNYLREGDLLVVNDTSVLPARFLAKKPTGGGVEIFFIRAIDDLEALVFLSPTRGLRKGSRLVLVTEDTVDGQDLAAIEVSIASLEMDDFRIRFDSVKDRENAFKYYGQVPLPPYIKRKHPRDEDRARYQTVFAKNPGAVAAPTAGLHFTEELKNTLISRGVIWKTLTLHVGPGTFLPVKSEDLSQHVMHEEYYCISQDTLDAVEDCRQMGGRIIPIGTTSLRALESWGKSGKRDGWTRLFIRPGFKFQVASGLLTNFHQPKSTLLMLVSALAERQRILNAYQEAIAKGYRLFSYGDCMLIV